MNADMKRSFDVFWLELPHVAGGCNVIVIVMVGVRLLENRTLTFLLLVSFFLCVTAKSSS